LAERIDDLVTERDRKIAGFILAVCKRGGTVVIDRKDAQRLDRHDDNRTRGKNNLDRTAYPRVGGNLLEYFARNRHASPQMDLVL
jgi:hypothetical protein